MNKIGDITTIDELARLLMVTPEKLFFIFYRDPPQIDKFYITFDIPKKNGDKRHIRAPKDDLKNIQRRLAQSLWEQQKFIIQNNKINNNISYAFEKNKSIIDNARIHRNKRILVSLDLQDFFDSFNFGRVRGFFIKNKYFKLSQMVATYIAQIACYDHCLPQGGPSSPIITNLICGILDNRLLQISRQYRLDYTRYADDLTFSTNDLSFKSKYTNFIHDISHEISHAGFKLNNEKTRICFSSSQQKVTGVIVNKKLNIERFYYKRTRAMLNKLYKDGSFDIDNKKGTIEQLEGRFAFINQFDRYNNKKDGENKKHNFHCLNGREKEYRDFLLYKYFFRQGPPLIFTEGKTDIEYIKSALKNLYQEYPTLICKNNEFQFMISFLRKSQRLKYFWGLDMNGGDSFIKLIQCLFSKCSKLKGRHIDDGILPHLYKKGKNIKKRPVIFLLDNEQNDDQNREKPLKKFTSNLEFGEEAIRILQSNLYIKLFEDWPWYLLITPLPNHMKESEIEDLFSEEVLQHKIKGKSFKRKASGGDGYSKEIFSKYISHHYKKIDFSGFKELLDAIKIIKESYDD